ncbi:MAG TPA: PAS domain-containing sensor histidine kinase [Ktedonobacteraceae bacterium]|nr:PAS domain-containing sensor histidine kinase [Ktedonobacteraceae bacterium]
MGTPPNKRDLSFSPHGENRSFHAYSSAEGTLPVVAPETIIHWLNFSPDAALVIDPAGTIVQLNAQAEALFGYPSGELISQPLEILLPHHLREIHRSQRDQYLHKPSARPMGTGLDLRGRRKDGSEFPVDISLRPFLLGEMVHVLGTIRDMTAQHKVAQERAQLTEQLRLQDCLLNLSHDAILVHDPQGHILSWNRGAEDLYGWKEQEVIGQVTHTLLATRFPNSRKRFVDHLEQEGGWDGDLIHVRRDGQQLIIESRQILVRDAAGQPTAVLEINRDVTERRHLEQMEQEVQSEREERLCLLQMILDHLPVGVFLMQSPHIHLLLANQAAEALWGAAGPQGQPQEDFLQQQGIQLLTPNGQPLSLDEWPSRRVIATGEPILQRQLVIRRADGVRIPIMVDALPLGKLSLLPHLSSTSTPTFSEDEQVVLMVYQDVSILKEAETLKDQFLSLATHELRTPVTVIAGFADLLLRAARSPEHLLDEWQRKKVQEMKQSCWQLAHLTEDLLDVTRMQAGQFHLERRLTDLVALTQQISKRLQATTSQHQITVQTTLVQLRARVDGCRIEQVLTNLLANAIKYSPAGGPIDITLWEEEQPHEAHFSIRDRGMGIPRAQQTYLFGRFVRAGNVQEAGIRGAGLGLYLCRELVERHGGRIWFESEEHVGSTFFFTLPMDAE